MEIVEIVECYRIYCHHRPLHDKVHITVNRHHHPAGIRPPVMRYGSKYMWIELFHPKTGPIKDLIFSHTSKPSLIVTLNGTE